VLVTIEEPHMYKANDAVARVDSYMVSVTGGGPFVGERKLVRIERVERSAAVASLPGLESSNGAGDGDDSEGDGEGDGEGGEGDGSQLESSGPRRRRRRGRRGGRGRSRAGSGD
jgi:hypothetical protein